MGGRDDKPELPTLADRAKLAPRPEPGGPRHCWVRDSVQSSSRWLPGVLLRWERRAGDWWALVAYAVPLRDGLAVRWVRATELRDTER